VSHEFSQDTNIIDGNLSSRQKSRVLISCKIPCIRSGWHNKTDDCRDFFKRI